ncbi:MAG: LPS export ABC transporter permease LptG [Methyloligellaceae bacterium]
MLSRGTLTRYMFMRFFLAILGVFFLFLFLIYLIDLVEMLRVATKRGGATFFTAAWITFLRLPAFAEICLPFAVLAGSIGSFLLLSRSSELIIARASGMSVWQFIMPAILVAILYGIISVTLYNPLAALAKAEAERFYAETYGKSTSVFKSAKSSGAWLRQNSVDGQSIISATNVANGGTLLTNVTIIQYDKNGKFFERIDAQKATLKNGRWVLSEVWVSLVGRDTVFYKNFVVSTNLTPTRVKDAFGSANSVSFWELPRFIDIAEKAGLSATRFKVQYQLLLSRPLVLISMVLLAATCSLKGFRFGNIQQMVISGLAAGFVYFMAAEVSRNVGMAGLTAPAIAVWVPVFIACCLTITVLLYQEDG